MLHYLFSGESLRFASITICVWVLLQLHDGRLLQANESPARGVIATVQPIATDAGLAAFDSGGNAVDAAVAAALTLGVVDGHNSGLGGGCFILIHTATGQIIAIDGRETAPATATRNMYVRDGQVVPDLSTTGPLAVAVPGALAAYQQAIKRHGKLKLSTLLKRAARVADAGFPIDAVYAGKLEIMRGAIEKFPATRGMLLNPDGTAYRAGETLRLPDLAQSYRAIAAEGTNWFYRGPFAEAVAAWMGANGGLLTADDFASYQPKDREPIETTYRGYQIIGFPPPSSGGIHVAQILNILENFELGKLLRDKPATAYHLIAEAMKLAFADRAFWLGDADFAKVPRSLIDKDYARRLAQRIDMTKTIEVASHGQPNDWQTNIFGKHTTHIAAADSAGNWVAITATINTTFGSKVVVPGTGILLNNEMDDFSVQPGVPNAFGLVGAEANAVAPGKRPLSSMSPTIVLKDGEPVLTLGGAGGPRIITEVVLAIIRFIDEKLPLDECLGRPRLHHQWRPDRLFLEEGFGEDMIHALKNRGHQIELLEYAGVAQAITLLPSGEFVGVSDPRVPGKAAQWIDPL